MGRGERSLNCTHVRIIRRSSSAGGGGPVKSQPGCQVLSSLMVILQHYVIKLTSLSC